MYHQGSPNKNILNLTLDFSAVFEFLWEGFIAFEVSVAKKKKKKNTHTQTSMNP